MLSRISIPIVILIPKIAKHNYRKILVYSGSNRFNENNISGKSFLSPFYMVSELLT